MVIPPLEAQIADPPLEVFMVSPDVLPPLTAITCPRNISFHAIKVPANTKSLEQSARPVVSAQISTYVLKSLSKTFKHMRNSCSGWSQSRENDWIVIWTSRNDNDKSPANSWFAVFITYYQEYSAHRRINFKFQSKPI